MEIINTVINAARKFVGTTAKKEIREVEFFQTPSGEWKFRSGVQVRGNYGSYADAERVARKYNFFNHKKQRKEIKWQ